MEEEEEEGKRRRRRRRKKYRENGKEVRGEDDDIQDLSFL